MVCTTAPAEIVYPREINANDVIFTTILMKYFKIKNLD